MNLPGKIEEVGGAFNTSQVKMYDWSPGNMTRYRVMFILVTVRAWIDLLGFADTEGPIWIVIHENAEMPVAHGVYLSPVYVSEKLNVGRGDAEMLAKLIKEVVG